MHTQTLEAFNGPSLLEENLIGSFWNSVPALGSNVDLDIGKITTGRSAYGSGLRSGSMLETSGEYNVDRLSNHSFDLSQASDEARATSRGGQLTSPKLVPSGYRSEAKLADMDPLTGAVAGALLVNPQAIDARVDSHLDNAKTPSTPSLLAASDSERAQEPPNIVFILADDLDAETYNRLPKLKSLMTDQGTSFSQSFVSAPICCPSRASILRGQYVRNHQVFGNLSPTGGFPKFYSLGHEKSTVATWLQDSGYRTALMGKYLNEFPGKTVPQSYVPPGWSEWVSPVDSNPFKQFNYKLNENGKIVAYGNEPQDYLGDVLSGKANDFIHRSATEDKPFFLYVSPFVPHAPAVAAPRHQDSFADVKQAPRTPSFNEADVSDKPAWVREKPPMSASEISKIDSLYPKRLKSMLALEDLVENTIQTLKATGELDNTYIFLTSDNGFHLGQHRLGIGKSTAYEEDIKVPLIVRGPDVPAGRVVDKVTSNIDLAPTFAQLAGAVTPPFVDGRSLLPLLDEDPQLSTWRQAVMIERFSFKGNESIPGYKALRTEDHKYIEYDTGERELYDLRKDPYELQNLASTVSPKLNQHFSGWLAKLESAADANSKLSSSKM